MLSDTDSTALAPPKPAPKRPLGFAARRETLHQVMQCRMLVLERRQRIARAQEAADASESVQGTDSECAFFLADLVEIEEEIATGVFRSAKRRRSFASARYAARHWAPGDPLLAVFAEIGALYKRC